MREQGIAAYDFSHDKLREQAYTMLSRTRRQFLHQRVLVALQEVGSPAAQLAYQALHTGREDLAFQYSVAAGDDAIRLGAMRDALAYYKQAQHLFVKRSDMPNQQKSLSIRDVHHFYVQFGRAYELNNEKQEAYSVYDSMLSYARTVHNPQMECVALNHLATLATWKSSNAEAALLLRDALRVAEDCGDRVILAETEWNLAQMSFYASDAEATQLHAERALQLARESKQEELVARSLNVLAYANHLLGRWEEVIRLADEARNAYAALGNRAMEADCLNLLAQTRIYAGQLQQGIAEAQAAYAISLEIENTWGQAHCAFNFALAAWESGSNSEALEIAQRRVDLARAQEFPSPLIISLFLLGMLQGVLLSFPSAYETLQEAATLNEAVSFQPATEAIAAALCMCHGRAGEWSHAYTYAVQGQEARNDKMSYVWHFSLRYEIEALLRGGDMERAEEELRRFKESMGINRRYHVAYLRAQAVVACWYGEIDQALTYLHQASILATEIGLRGELEHIEMLVSELEQKRDEG